MHPDDEKKRGYNQAQLLAEKIAENMGIPCLPLLRKDFKTQSQHNLPQMKRSGNLLGAISFNTGCNTEITGARILLCDDIKTTGSTLDECTKTLLFEDCAEVRCVTACVSYNNAKRKD
jgi:predicted amidophosphoribosyltransferase